MLDTAKHLLIITVSILETLVSSKYLSTKGKKKKKELINIQIVTHSTGNLFVLQFKRREKMKETLKKTQKSLQLLTKTDLRPVCLLQKTNPYGGCDLKLLLIKS